MADEASLAGEILAEVAARARRHFLPFALAALGVAVQMRWLLPRELPSLLVALLLSPAKLLLARAERLLKPRLAPALARVRAALPSVVGRLRLVAA